MSQLTICKRKRIFHVNKSSEIITLKDLMKSHNQCEIANLILIKLIRFCLFCL